MYSSWCRWVSRASHRCNQVLTAMNWSSGPAARDILDFTTQLAVMIRAGISLRQALDGIADQVTNVKFQKMLQAIKHDVESGKQFSEAIAKYPRYFNPLYINMVRASEMSGSFAKMLDRIAAFMSQQMETRKMVVSASIYPGIIAVMAISVTIFLLTFVLPRFAGVFEGKEDVLPWPTIFLMGLSTWMVNYWWVLIVAGVLGIIGLSFYMRTETGRFWIDHLKLKAPLVPRNVPCAVCQPLAPDDGRTAQCRRTGSRQYYGDGRHHGEHPLQAIVDECAQLGPPGQEAPQRARSFVPSCRSPSTR